MVDAELCKGSTADSDSVCLGSNPSSAATKPRIFYSGLVFFRGVAQFGSALRSGRRGRRFESCHLDHIGAQVLIQCLRSFSFCQKRLAIKIFATFVNENNFIVIYCKVFGTVI